AGVDNLFAAGDRRRQAGALAADPGEVAGEAVEVVLAPDLERVVVTAGAVEPDAEEELADHRGDLVRLAAVAEDDGGAVAEGAAAGGEELAHELVVGQVLPEGVAQPGVQVVDRLDADAVGVGPQQVGPLVGPEV